MNIKDGKLEGSMYMSVAALVSCHLLASDTKTKTQEKETNGCVEFL